MRHDFRNLLSSFRRVLAGLLPPVFVVVAADRDGRHRVVEVYLSQARAWRRYEELQGRYLGRNVSYSSRALLAAR